ncbi:MAG: hypothetical protein LQ338_006544 [Usnochroma carphineum]|nr:MAG: hypothetical protein LQ338_006544 [Usnochroma carphineum]
MVSQTTDGSSTRANAGSSTQEVDGVNHDDVLDSPTTESDSPSVPANQELSTEDDAQSQLQEVLQLSITTGAGSWAEDHGHVQPIGSASASWQRDQHAYQTLEDEVNRQKFAGRKPREGNVTATPPTKPKVGTPSCLWYNPAVISHLKPSQTSSFLVGN